MPGLPDWEPCIHPEGRLYFYHQQKASFPAHTPTLWAFSERDTLQKIYTDCDIRDPQVLATLYAFTRVLEGLVHENGLTLPADHDLVLFLEPRRTMPGFNWIYYYADHTSRTLFWVQECDPVAALGLIEVRAMQGPYDISESALLCPPSL